MKHLVSEPITACNREAPNDCHREVSNACNREASNDCHREVSNDPELVEGFGREPTLPAAFRWRNETLEIKAVLARRRSTKVDRGDTYLKRHWFDLETSGGRIVTVYYDRAAKRGQPHWWLYAIEE